MAHEGQTDVAVVREWYDALANGDGDGIRGALAEDVEWNEAEGFPYGGTYHGPDAVMENVLGPLGTEWEGFEADPDRFLDCGERVVVLGTYRGTYGETGAAFEAPFAHVIAVEDGRFQRFDQYTDTALVQRAVEG